MSLINTGRGLQKSAYSGFGTVAQLEAKRDAEYEAMLAAEDAQEKATMGGLTFTPTAAAGTEATILKGVEATDAINKLATGAEATGQVVTATQAAAASSPLATLSAVAAPLAIGVGLAYLLNKLF